MQSPGDENLGADSIGPMLLGHPPEKVKKFAPNFDVYVERLDWPTAPQHPHRGGGCRRRASLSKVVVCERKNNRTELDGPRKLRRWEGYHAPQRPRRAATRRLLVDEDGMRTSAHNHLPTVMLQTIVFSPARPV